MRNRVVGPDYVSRSLAVNSSDFTRPLQQFATESAWGTIWTRPGLSLRDRSLLNLVMLTALGKWVELGTHVRGAVRNGCSEVEIREALLQARYVFKFLFLKMMDVIVRCWKGGGKGGRIRLMIKQCVLWITRWNGSFSGCG